MSKYGYRGSVLENDFWGPSAAARTGMGPSAAARTC